MSGLTYACVGVRGDRYAAGPTLLFRLRITSDDDERVHAIALRCQLRIEPALRGYRAAEAAGLGDLFGEPERWGRTLQPMRFAQVSLVVPGFTRETEVDLPVPVSYDLDIATTKYFAALTDGEVPLLLLFSGTAFCGPGGFTVHPVPWDREAACRMPVAVWRAAIDEHFPGCGWLRLPGAVLDELLAYRSRHAFGSWESALRALLDTAADERTGPRAPRAVPDETLEGTAP